MAETSARSNPIAAASEVVSGLVRPVVKDAVVEAMQEVESEQQSSGSSRRLLPGLLLIGVGFVLGALLVKRRVRHRSRFDDSIDEVESAAADSTGEDVAEATSTEDADTEEAVDTSASS